MNPRIWRIAAVGAAAAVIVVLGVAQLVLPGIAAQRLRAQLSRSGQVVSVQVSAFPAIELLWHHADRVAVRLGRYDVPPADLAASLGQAAQVGSLSVSARTVHDGLLTLHDVTLVKHGHTLDARASVAESDLRAAVPLLQSVTPVASSGGQLVLRGTANVLGLSAAVDAVVSAQSGRLVIAPDVPFGGLASLTVFEDPRVSVQSVRAAPAPGGFMLSGTAAVT